MAPPDEKFDRGKLEDLLKRRFFYVPSFEIYGGKLVRCTTFLQCSNQHVTICPTYFIFYELPLLVFTLLQVYSFIIEYSFLSFKFNSWILFKIKS